MKTRRFIINIIVITIISVISFWVGSKLSQRSESTPKAEGNDLYSLFEKSSGNKIGDFIDLIEDEYVDGNILTDSVKDDIMQDIVSKLDPHSVYIPASDLEEVNNEIEGRFSGIGVQFNIQKDTVMIVDVINRGPSEKVGLLPGDRIIAVNDTPFVGKNIVTNKKVMKKLRGKKGTKVKLGIKRLGTNEKLSYDIIRGDIPIESVTASYIIEPNIGFIGLNSNFGTHTYQEFLIAIAKLKSQGAKKFIIDLRNNGGGLLNVAIKMINEFLPKDQLIVYAEGKAYPRSDAFANGSGSCINNPIVVLIDEFSASASEIFAGAIQDNDRGLIIGRRSFGKGLVQSQIPFDDGSAVRLTIAKYFTPSGRSIQKPYKNGKGVEYEMDLIKRFEHGEFYSKDSIQVADSLKFKTLKGRTVYGGGGIMPDIFVPRDTTEYSAYSNRVINRGYTYQYAFEYTDQHRKELSKYKTWKELDKHIPNKILLNGFINFVKKKGIKPNYKDLRISKNLLLRRIKAYIIRNILHDNEYFQMINSKDKSVLKAVEELKK